MAFATGKTPTSTSTSLDWKDFEEARNLVRVDQLWNKPLDWKEKGASTADIVAHLRLALGKETLIEVRGKDTNLSTFELPQAPLGPTLFSVASLADTQLWAFPGRLLVAPENLLSPEERALIKAGTSGEWIDSSTAGGKRWNALERFQFVAATLVGIDLKERFAAKGLTPVSTKTEPRTTGRGDAEGPFIPSAEPPLAYELLLSDLNPSTKEILQDLADVEWERTQVFRRMAHPGASLSQEKAPSLDASTIVCFDDVQSSQIQLVLQKGDPVDATKRKTLNRWYVSKPRLPLS